VTKARIIRIVSHYISCCNAKSQSKDGEKDDSSGRF
jgi:hypothetical protein